MTTVVNNPGPSSDGNGGSAGMIIGIIVLVLIVFLVFFYGLPYLRGTSQDVTVPQQENTSVEENAPALDIDVPDQLDVNVNETQ